MSAVAMWLASRHIPHWRMNSGALKTQRGRLVRFGAKGMADIHAIGPGGVAIWIECKRPAGAWRTQPERPAIFLKKPRRGLDIRISRYGKREARRRKWNRRRKTTA